MSRLEWLGKVNVEIMPDWHSTRVKAALAAAAHNKVVIRLAELWRLIAQTVEPKHRIEVRPIKDGEGTGEIILMPTGQHLNGFPAASRSCAMLIRCG